MDDALLATLEIEIGDAELLRIAIELFDHGIRQRISEWLFKLIGRDDVIHRREGALRVPDGKSEVTEHAESLGAGHLVDEVRVDEQLRLSVGQFRRGVRLPDLLV